METAAHIAAEKLRELYERTGLSVAQFARLLGASERTAHNAMAGSGLQGDRYARQYELIQKTTAELELEAVQELTPTVAFNSPRLRELMLRKFLKSNGGASPFHQIRNQVVEDQQIRWPAFRPSDYFS